MGLARGSGFAPTRSRPKAVPGAEPDVVSQSAARQSLAAHPAAEPYQTTLKAKVRDKCGGSLQQLRLKIRQIKVLSIRLDLSLRVDLKDADALDKEDVSGPGLKT